MNLPRTQKPPWHWTKRLQVSAFFSLAFLGIALAIGGGIYLVGRMTGLFASQSIKTNVETAIKNDPGLQAVIARELTLNRCDNTALDFSVQYPTGWQDMDEPGTCAQFFLRGDPQKAVAELRVHQGEKEAVLHSLMQDVEKLVTDEFTHPTYDAVQFSGMRNRKPFLTVVLFGPNGKSLSATVVPYRTEIYEPIALMVRNIMLQ